MRIDEIMSRSVISVSPHSTVGDAIELFLSRKVHHLLVMNGTTLVGIVAALELSGKDSSTPLSNIMNREVRTAPPSATVKDVARLMIGRTSGCIPVVEAGRIVGIVTTSDLMRVLTTDARRPVMA